jgi:hypothetical protein
MSDGKPAMNSLMDTTYYPAILLRQRWLGATASERRVFDPAAELAQIWAAAPLTSSEVSALERWAAEFGIWHSDERPSRRKQDLQPASHDRRQTPCRSGRVRRAMILGASLKRMPWHIEASQMIS